MLGALLLTAATACSPSQSNPGGQSDAPVGSGSSDGGVIDASTIDSLSAMDACAQLAMAKCAKLMSCSPTDLTRRFADVGTCTTREALACTDQQEAVDTAATTGQAVQCSTAITASSCTDFLGATAPAACLAPDGPGAGGCAFGAQCDTSFCSVGANAVCGECVATPVVGTSCATSSCGSGLVCAPGNKLCAVPGAANAQCNETAPCSNGLTCVGTTKNNPGRCQPELTAANGQCDAKHNSRADCSADDGLACNANTGRCVALGLAAAGGKCGEINNVKTVCTAGSECFTPTGQQTGTCLAPAGDGSACNLTAGPDCLTPARCVPTGGTGSAGTCELPGLQVCQ
jgi:hypothetical protein